MAGYATSQDAHGNIVHSFYDEGPISRLSIRIEGLVETLDLAGVVRGGVERGALRGLSARHVADRAG